MPSKQWTQNHRVVKVWLEPAEYNQLKTACRDRTLADVLRQAIATIIKENNAAAPDLYEALQELLALYIKDSSYGG